MKPFLIVLAAASMLQAATVNICSTATCNGSTNDAAAVQAAINGSSSGDTIVWTGTTKVNSVITFLSNRTYLGTGGGLLNGAVTTQFIQLPANAATNITIQNLTIDGGGIGGGILSSASSTATSATNITITGNVFQHMRSATDYGADAIHAQTGMTDSTISGNSFTDIYDSRHVNGWSEVCGAVWFFDPSGITISNNTFTQTTQAIHVTANQADANVTITGNTIHRSARYNIEVQGNFSVNNVTVSGNTIDTPQAGINGQAGISVAVGGTGHLIDSNVLLGPNLGAPSNQSDAIEAMGTAFIISNNRAGHWGEAQLIGFSDNTWQTVNNFWCDMNNQTPPQNVILLETGGMAPGTNTGNTAAATAAAACPTGASPTNPTAPQSVPTAVRPTPTGSVIPIHSGTDLQATYNAAACGSDLVLDAGITKTGNFVFNKQCSAPNWILIEAAGCNAGTVPIPTYVTTASVNSASVPPFATPSLTNYATINSTNGAPPIQFTDGTTPGKYNYLGCIEVTASVSQGSLIYMATLSETVASQLPDHLMLDRNYIHGVPASASIQMSRGVLMGGSNISIVNNYISQIYQSSGDAQALLGTAGTAGYLIQNNFLSASTEIILFGGTGATPGYSCTIAASPAPTTTAATVSSCVDGNSGSVSTPAIGTVVMFKTSSGAPAYLPTDSTVITGNTAGALTFGAIHAPPIAGAAKALWGIVPTDITITKNFLYKPPSWNPSDPSYDGVTRSSKNCIEDKYGQRWNINGNVCINTWNNGQNFAFNINVTDQNGDCPWCISSDVSLTNNVFKNIAGEFVIISAQSFAGPCPGYLKRVLIQNNLFFVPGAAASIASGGTVFELAGYTGCGLSGGGTDSLQVLHNHLLGAGINMRLASGLPYNFTNLVIKDNITEFDQYRWTNQCPDSAGFVDGSLCLTADVSTGPTWTAINNAIINSGAINGGQGVSDATITSRYGSIVLPTFYDTTQGTNYAGAPFASYSTVSADYHGFALTGSGPWRNAASDHTDPGVNFSLLDAVLGSASTLTCSPKTNLIPPTVTDIQLQTNMALRIIACTNDIASDGCGTTSVQRVVNAALGGACVTGP
jgi:hypothetical protein